MEEAFGGITALETASRCGNARAPPLYSELDRRHGIRHPRDRGLRSFAGLASATLLEAVLATERDDATRLAQRCYLRPHSIAILRTRPAAAAEFVAQSNVFRTNLRAQHADPGL